MTLRNQPITWRVIVQLAAVRGGNGIGGDKKNPNSMPPPEDSGSIKLPKGDHRLLSGFVVSSTNWALHWVGSPDLLTYQINTAADNTPQRSVVVVVVSPYHRGGIGPATFGGCPLLDGRSGGEQ